ncbi:MAG: hypothetical protein GY850_38195, partial [bacterium]|nr:hypothetical protein [bacterium]
MMKRFCQFSLPFLLNLLMLFFLFCPTSSQADAADDWWDEAWPYRIPVNTGGSGVAQVSIDFTAAFNTLGLNGALLDVRSIRVVPYTGNTPGTPVDYQESYSVLLEDGEEGDPTAFESNGVRWNATDGSVSRDN